MTPDLCETFLLEVDLVSFMALRAQEKNKWREGIDVEIVPTVGKHPPSKPWDLGQRHVQGQFCICSCGKEIRIEDALTPCR